MHAFRIKHDAGTRAWLASQEDVARDVDIVAEGQVLVDHLDAHLVGVTRRGEDRSSAVDPYLSRIGDVGAREDLHERGLAGRVIADETDDFAGGDAEGHPPQCFDRAEPLAYIPEDNAIRSLRCSYGGTLHVTPRFSIGEPVKPCGRAVGDYSKIARKSSTLSEVTIAIGTSMNDSTSSPSTSALHARTAS